MLESGGAGAEWSLTSLGPDPGVCMPDLAMFTVPECPPTHIIRHPPQGINNFNRRLPNKHLFKQASGDGGESGVRPSGGQHRSRHACADLQRPRRLKMARFLSLKCIAWTLPSPPTRSISTAWVCRPPRRAAQHSAASNGGTPSTQTRPGR